MCDVNRQFRIIDEYDGDDIYGQVGEFLEVQSQEWFKDVDVNRGLEACKRKSKTNSIRFDRTCENRKVKCQS